MKPPFQKLLSRIDKEADILPFLYLREFLSEEEIRLLETRKILVRIRDLEELPCESCGNGEISDVKLSKKGYLYATCPHSGNRQSVDPKKLRQWKIDRSQIPKKEQSAVKRLIEKDTRGDFFYGGKRIELPKTAEYSLLFDILYTHSGQDGFLSYEDIEQHLIKKHLEPKPDIAERNKRIQNLVYQGIFRYAQINGQIILNDIPDGRSLVEIRRGKGLIFNNPAM